MMDLFSHQIKRRSLPFLEKWDDVINYSTFLFLDVILNRLKLEYQSKTIYPEKQDIFRIFKSLSLEQIKVVILGQDPYYNGLANGYAFGSKNGSIPKSMMEIRKSMGKETMEFDPSFSYLVNQGVFLYNVILTVEKDKPNSHKNIGWITFSGEIVKLISEKTDNVVWMLWGKEAQAFKDIINNKKHLILEHTHPAFAVRSKIDWKCDHFEKANQYLESVGKTKINWI